MTERHARALLRVYDTDLREKLLNQIIEEGLNVRQTEKLVNMFLQEKPKKSKAPKDEKTNFHLVDKSSFLFWRRHPDSDWG